MDVPFDKSLDLGYVLANGWIVRKVHYRSKGMGAKLECVHPGNNWYQDVYADLTPGKERLLDPLYPPFNQEPGAPLAKRVANAIGLVDGAQKICQAEKDMKRAQEQLKKCQEELAQLKAQFSASIAKNENNKCAKSEKKAEEQEKKKDLPPNAP